MSKGEDRMSGHTPGPWRVIPRDGKFPNAVQRGRQGGFEVRGLDNETEDADARLIAAAPDMLSALQVAELALRERGLRACGEYKQIEAALAKATGGAE